MLPTVDKMSIDQGLDLSSYMFTSFGAYFFYPLAPPPTSPLEIYFAALARVCLAHHRSYVEAIAQLLFVFGRGFSPPSGSIGGIGLVGPQQQHGKNGDGSSDDSS
jgi:hypothetical protein